MPTGPGTYRPRMAHMPAHARADESRCLNCGRKLNAHSYEELEDCLTQRAMLYAQGPKKAHKGRKK